MQAHLLALLSLAVLFFSVCTFAQNSNVEDSDAEEPNTVFPLQTKYWSTDVTTAPEWYDAEFSSEDPAYWSPIPTGSRDQSNSAISLAPSVVMLLLAMIQLF